MPQASKQVCGFFYVKKQTQNSESQSESREQDSQDPQSLRQDPEVLLRAILLILVVGVLLSSSSQSAEPVSQKMLDYAPVIQRYAREYGILDYVQVIQAIVWKENGYSPAARANIFDWDGDGVSDHVAIMEKCENGRVYTVEGNSNDRAQKSIYIGSNLILGYGVVA